MPTPPATTPAECYDRSLRYARGKNLPPDMPRPLPTAHWPPENLVLFERYVAWLLEGGTAEYATRVIYLPAAGHVLGLNIKPHAQLDLNADFAKVLDYVQAKGCGPDWLKATRNGLEKFRRFLRVERGLGLPNPVKAYDVAANTQGLPAWLVSELTRYQRIQQRNWRPARLDEGIRRFWSGHLRMWRFFCEKKAVQQFADLKRQHILDYLDFRLDNGRAVSGINGDLYTLQAFLGFLQQEGYPVPQAFFRIKGLKPAETLPKFLPDEQIKKLRDEIELQTAQVMLASHRRDALLTRAAFYLLWQSGLRLGEVEELRLEDLELPARRLTVRNGKGLKDRTVYLTDTTVVAVNDYLAMRGPGTGDHVFLYRNQPLRKDLIRARLKYIGEDVGVKVYPHRLRHTCATQLLNAGCRITSLQKFLGHKKLDTTMIYAKAHDQTVADDYYAAMQRVEARLDIAPTPIEEPAPAPPIEPDRTQLLALTEQLAAPQLDLTMRLMLVAQMQSILCGKSEMPIPVSFPVPAMALSFSCEGAALGGYVAAGP